MLTNQNQNQNVLKKFQFIFLILENFFQKRNIVTKYSPIIYYYHIWQKFCPPPPKKKTLLPTPTQTQPSNWFFFKIRKYNYRIIPKKKFSNFLTNFGSLKKQIGEEQGAGIFNIFTTNIIQCGSCPRS